jgi:predicted  nucleic acid-binding Zn-ribbon protein
MATLVVVEELQEQLLVWERELDNQEGVIVAWEDGLAASKCAPRRVCMEHEVECAQTEGVQQNYLAWSCALTANSKYSINLNRMLEEHHILPSLQETGLEVWEVKLAEEQACGLHSFNR